MKWLTVPVLSCITVQSACLVNSFILKPLLVIVQCFFQLPHAAVVVALFNVVHAFHPKVVVVDDNELEVAQILLGEEPSCPFSILGGTVFMARKGEVETSATIGAML